MFDSLLVFGVMMVLMLLSVSFFSGKVAEGTHMRCYSATTTVLSFMAEKIEKKPRINILTSAPGRKLALTNRS